MRIDHAVLAVRDLDASAARMWEDHGLASVPGGTHPRWGTANRLVPLGHDYLELLAVVDPQIGRATWLGRRLLELSGDGDAWFAICLDDERIDATAARLGLEVEAGSRTRPDGTVLRWRGVGIEDPHRAPSLPFFISWDVPRELHPGATPIAHRASATEIVSVRTGGTTHELDAWVGGAAVAIVPEGGSDGVHAVQVGLADGGSIAL